MDVFTCEKLKSIFNDMCFLLPVKEIILLNMMTQPRSMSEQSLCTYSGPVHPTSHSSHCSSCQLSTGLTSFLQVLTAPHLSLRRSSHFLSQSLRKPFGTHRGVGQGVHPRSMGNRNQFWDNSIRLLRRSHVIKSPSHRVEATPEDICFVLWFTSLFLPLRY